MRRGEGNGEEVGEREREAAREGGREEERERKGGGEERWRKIDKLALCPSLLTYKI